ncbi:hypothetical protein HGA92_02035 [Candidatus Gracilibacteria bacterium]|nr:hypothetical protein [Candidatus Gracilibacteria bacterium]NUJ99442.1 hypothetical protein [Candidatus Gracilibacteria bacterium]
MFAKSVEDMSLNSLIKYITKTFHEPLRKDLKKIELLVPYIIENYSKKYPEITHLSELFSQFRKEILKHITREDIVVFPTILKFERLYTDKLINLSDNFEIINSLVNDIQMKNQHMEFNLYLDSIVQLLEGLSIIDDEKIKDFKEFQSIFVNIQKNNVIHAKIENENLYSKGIQLQNELKEKLAHISNDL